MQILDGKLVSQHRRSHLKNEVSALTKQTGRAPQLVVVVVGEHPASAVYVRNKIKACEDLGIKSTRIALPDACSESELRANIEALNADQAVDGILVQLPVPKQINAEKINEWIAPTKDIDGFTYEAMGRLWANKSLVGPCTPVGIMSLLEYYKIPVAGKYAVVVGRSHIVGKPMAHLLTSADATVTLCHSKTKNLSEFTRAADIVVVAAGRKGLLGKEDFKQGAVVIDVGMHGSGSGGELCGDVRFSELKDWVSAATPVPGGVGPMTITTLLENTVKLAKLAQLKLGSGHE